MADFVLPFSDPAYVDTYEVPPPGPHFYRLPFSNPKYVDTTQIGPRFTGLFSDPKFVTTTPATTVWSGTDEAGLVPAALFIP